MCSLHFVSEVGTALPGSGAATWAQVVQSLVPPRLVDLIASYSWSDGSGKLGGVSGL